MDDQKAVVDTCTLGKTRNNGKHLRYFTETPQPTEKLSRSVVGEKIETTSETRAEGSYALIPPSAGYEFLRGDLEHLPLVSDEMHGEFIDILRTFNEVEDEPQTEYEGPKPGSATGAGDRPGDRLNAHMSWEEILGPHGWVLESKNRWRRPGKKAGEGISATTDYDGTPMFYVFSSAAAPFKPNKGYSKFHVFALLNYGSDFKAAAKKAAELYPSDAGSIKTEPRQHSAALVVRFSEINPETVSWLWDGRIALGKLTLIAGDPGLGKSLITAALAASVSKGSMWPVEAVRAPLGGTLFLSAEDDPADTIRPRLDAAGADCERVHLLRAIKVLENDGTQSQRIFSLKRDMSVLERELKNIPDCKLIIIDPISAYLDGTDSHKNSDVRGLLAPLAELAAQNKVAIILVHHLNKSSGTKAIYRMMGSLAFTAAVRAAYLVTKDTNNPDRRIFLPVKNNLAKDTSGFAYTVQSTASGQPVIEWEPLPIKETADEILAQESDRDDLTETDWAVTVLEDILANGPLAASVVSKQAKEAGVKEKALRRAKEKLGIKPYRNSFNGPWWWELPKSQDAQDDGVAPSKGEGALDDVGHLGHSTEQAGGQSEAESL